MDFYFLRGGSAWQLQADSLENWGFLLLLHSGFLRQVGKVTDFLRSCLSLGQAGRGGVSWWRRPPHPKEPLSSLETQPAPPTHKAQKGLGPWGGGVCVGSSSPPSPVYNLPRGLCKTLRTRGGCGAVAFGGGGKTHRPQGRGSHSSALLGWGCVQGPFSVVQHHDEGRFFSLAGAIRPGLSRAGGEMPFFSPNLRS